MVVPADSSSGVIRRPAELAVLPLELSDPDAIEMLACHCDVQSLSWSRNIRIARSRTSGKYPVERALIPTTQQLSLRQSQGGSFCFVGRVEAGFGAF